jgi:flagellar hook-associated protein 1 FlgK
MSSLISSLLSGSAALTAQSKGLEVTGNNLANVNTPGYSRQTVQISSGAMIQGAQGPEPLSVQISGVTQARSTFLDQQVTFEKSLTGSMSTLNGIYQQVQSALGQNIDTSAQSNSVSSASGSAGGISGALSAFFNSFQALAANPSDPTAKNIVLSQAQTLATQINRADQNLAQVQTNTTDQINTDVTTVNGLLKNIADLNLKISKTEANAPGSALDFRDQRQSALEQLAGYLNFSTANGTGGQMQINAQDSSGNAVTLVDGANVANPVGFNGGGFTAGAAATPLALTSGSLTSELSARDSYTQSVRGDLASFSSELIGAVNGAYNPGGTGGNFFAAGTGGNLITLASGLTAGTLKTTTGTDAGGNDLAVAVASMATTSFSTGSGASIDGTLGGFFGSLVGRVGEAASSATSNLEDQQLTQQLAISQRDQVSGVSMDEETTNLMKYQRAFQASARFVNTIDQMLDTVVNHMGA